VRPLCPIRALSTIAPWALALGENFGTVVDVLPGQFVLRICTAGQRCTASEEGKRNLEPFLPLVRSLPLKPYFLLSLSSWRRLLGVARRAAADGGEKMAAGNDGLMCGGGGRRDPERRWGTDWRWGTASVVRLVHDAGTSCRRAVRRRHPALLGAGAGPR
jgi:hypothetical protein